MKSLKCKKHKKIKNQTDKYKDYQCNNENIENVQLIVKKEKKKLLQKKAQQNLYQFSQFDTKNTHHNQQLISPYDISPWNFSKYQQKEKCQRESMTTIKNKILKSKISSINKDKQDIKILESSDRQNMQKRIGQIDEINDRQWNQYQTLNGKKKENGFSQKNLFTKSNKLRAESNQKFIGTQKNIETQNFKLLFRRILEDMNHNKQDDFIDERKKSVNLTRPSTSYNKRIRSRQQLENQNNLKFKLYCNKSMNTLKHPKIVIVNKQNERYQKCIFYPTNNPLVKNLYKNKIDINGRNHIF